MKRHREPRLEDRVRSSGYVGLPSIDPGVVVEARIAQKNLKPQMPRLPDPSVLEFGQDRRPGQQKKQI